MNARLPSICWASLAEAENAARADRAEAEDAELDTYVREYYGPPFVAEFVQEALQAAQYELAQQIATASERMGQSLNPEHQHGQLHGRVAAVLCPPTCPRRHRGPSTKPPLIEEPPCTNVTKSRTRRRLHG